MYSYAQMSFVYHCVSEMEPVDMLCLATENESLKIQVDSLVAENSNLKKTIKQKDELLQNQKEHQKVKDTLLAKLSLKNPN